MADTASCEVLKVDAEPIAGEMIWGVTVTFQLIVETALLPEYKTSIDIDAAGETLDAAVRVARIQLREFLRGALQAVDTPDLKA